MSTNEVPTRTVSVVGEGRATLPPDLATIQLGVETTDTTLATAQAENAALSTTLRERLHDRGIASRDIQTTAYQVGRDHGPEGPRGYRVANFIRVTIRALDTLGATLDAAIDAGANQVHQIAFRASDPSTAEQQAREAAMADARARAEHYATLAGLRLGEVLAIAEAGATPPPHTQGGMMFAMRASTPIDPGEETITVTIQITYALLPGANTD